MAKTTKKAVSKQSPTSSEVHVPVAGEEEKLRKDLIETEDCDEYDTDDDECLDVDKDYSDNEEAGMNMQDVVDGMDWEMANGVPDEETARDIALDNLSVDPEHYNKKKPDGQPNIGYNLDLGSGASREPGHIGLDLYPHDYGTIIHDLNMGIPFPDESCANVKMMNSMESMEGMDPKAILSEIQRVLMPGGQFVYQGPNDIYNHPEWTQDYPGLVLTDHEDSLDQVDKADGSPSFKQTFTRIAVPDAATADDAEPRIGISQDDMLPADALLAMDALGYYWSDATSSGRGNRLYGYPSQGALVDKSGVKKNKKHIVPIVKADKMKQVVYCVVLSPDEVDAQDDWMPAEEIENTAHSYLEKYRVIGKNHEGPIKASPVESYIAPVDFEVDGGPYGPQKVKKGSWVIGIKVKDAKEWQKVLNGDYQGVSVGGFGLRDGA